MKTRSITKYEARKGALTKDAAAKTKVTGHRKMFELRISYPSHLAPNLLYTSPEAALESVWIHLTTAS